MNKNIKNMLAELEREFPGVYEAPHQGLYIFVCSMDKVYEDETKTDFDELGKLATKRGLSFDELGYLYKKWGIMRWEKHILMLKIYMETDIEK